MVETNNSYGLRSVELMQRDAEMLGVQGRLLLADPRYLDPNRPCTAADIDGIVSFEQRDYAPYEQKSFDNRQAYWRAREAADHSLASSTAQKEAWVKGMTDSLGHPANRAILNTLSPLLQKSGITETTANNIFTAEHANNMYQRYFSSPERGNQKGVKQFVRDIQMTYTANGRINRQQLIHDLPQIHYLANTFGDQEKEVIALLSVAETNLIENPTFKTDLQKTRWDPATNTNIMRINDLGPVEAKILSPGSVYTPPIHETQPKPPPVVEQPNDEEEEATAPKELPIMKHKSEIQKRIKEQETTIIIGGTGSGKTLKIPQMIREIMGEKGRLAVTEPRQINTSELAASIAREAGVTLGQEIGYQHGGNTVQSKELTDTLFMTEGTLLQMLLKDKHLENYTHVMVDEVHVRSADTEQLLYYLREAQKLRKKKGMAPLKIITASATVNKKELEDYFGGTPTLEVEGRTHGITPTYSDRKYRSSEMHNQAAYKAEEILRDPKSEGDIIIFVAGLEDISKTAKLIPIHEYPGASVHQLHAGSTDKEKEVVGQEPKPGERRIIISTNFAETGITILGLKHVINTGEEYERKLDTQTGLEYLEKSDQSQAGCDQRAGRVGRMSPGFCHNLFPEPDYLARQPYPTPELQRINLTKLVMNMKKREIQNLAEVQFLSPLKKELIDDAEQTLRLLGAVKQDGTLNEIGKKMTDIQTDDYHLARMIAEAVSKGRGADQIGIIAVMSQARKLFLTDRDSYGKEKPNKALQEYKDERSDFLTYLKIWEEYQKQGESRDVWAKEKQLNLDVLRKIQEDKDQLYKKSRIPQGLPEATYEELEEYIAVGLADRVMELNEATRTYRWNQKPAIDIPIAIDRGSVLARNAPKKMLALNNSKIDRTPDKFGKKKPIYFNGCQRLKAA